MKYFIKVLMTPSCWLQNYPYSEQLDKFLKNAIKNSEFTNIREHHASINGIILWIANHPYASFTMKLNGHDGSVRPARTTILRAQEKLVEDKLKARD